MTGSGGTERRAVAAHLRRQAGVIGRSQAVAAGLSPDVVDRHLAARRWVPVLPRVYRDEAHRPTDAARVWAAMLWAGDDGGAAVLSGAAAAWWLGMAPALTGPVVVTVPRHRSPRPRAGVRIRRRDLHPSDCTERDGIAVTAAPLTVLEAAVELGGPFFDRALQSRVTFDEVAATYARNLGCHGSAAMRELLVAAADRSASVAERLLLRHLRAARVSSWRCNHPVLDFLVDVAFPRARVAIEVDGWAWHLDAERRQRDHRRQNILVRHGWTVLRYSWHDLTTRPRSVVAEIVHTVAAAP